MSSSSTPWVSDSKRDIDFHHPFTPYDVQHQFMKTIYDILNAGNGQVGILESPTGTGKSLSLICASLTWLRSHKSSIHEDAIKNAVQDLRDEPDWVLTQFLQRKHEDLVMRWRQREEKLEKLRVEERARELRSVKRRRIGDGPAIKARCHDDELQWLLDIPDSESDPEPRDPYSGLSKEARQILGLGLPKDSQDDDLDDDFSQETKIFYTSRTHSQLTQFISELRRPEFPPSLPQSLERKEGPGQMNTAESVKHLPLSSRQKLCINPSVSSLGSIGAINDRCAELQQSKKESCQFMPREENLADTNKLRDTALATLPDIEDLFHIGKQLAICPYYASRTAVPGAEIITLPYPLLLQKNARDALGIKLEGSVVIIDEAHNIMDAISNVYAAEIRLSDLQRGRQMLGVYVRKFGKKLKGENRVMVGQVGRVIDGLSEWLEVAMKQRSEQGIVDTSALMRPKGVDQINLYKLIQYIQDSKLAYKVEGYATEVEEQKASETLASYKPSKPVLHTLVSFLSALTNLSSEGRIFYKKDGDDIGLSYLLLSPTHAFSSILSSARAVILAGGTMSPFEDYTAHLFPTLPASKITTLSCGHVIPPSNLLVWSLAGTKPNAPSHNTEFEFSFQHRGNKNMLLQLGLALLNICSIVPDGVVVFFPSYGYLDEVASAWSMAQTADPPTIWARLQSKKKLFRETRGGSSDDILEQFGNAILGTPSGTDKGCKGALLLSVVGGKMSEGINFSDRLGRCVVIVGLPYPNINSPEWKAKMEYVESTTLLSLSETQVSSIGSNASSDAISKSKQVARDFYENACMRAVNQSIGRAIRHRNDYAAIVLVDRRYGTDRIRGKLPTWIRDGMVLDSQEKGVPQLIGALSGFFRDKKDGTA